MTSEMTDLIIVLLLILGVASLTTVLAFCGVIAWIWSKGEYVDGNSVKGMFRSVLRAWEHKSEVETLDEFEGE